MTTKTEENKSINHFVFLLLKRQYEIKRTREISEVIKYIMDKSEDFSPTNSHPESKKIESKREIILNIFFFITFNRKNDVFIKYLIYPTLFATLFLNFF